MSEHAKSISFVLNGSKTELLVETHENLVELLVRMNLNGARESCGQGLCGCCTVIVDGSAVSGCLYPAAFVDGKTVTTVEHLDHDVHLSPVQEAFIEEGAFQCGFCTSGFILMTHQLLEQKPMPTDEEIRDYLAGNLCRCMTYTRIRAAIKKAAASMETR